MSRTTRVGGRRSVMLDVGSSSALVWMSGRDRVVEVPTRVEIPVPSSDRPGDQTADTEHGIVRLVERGVVRHPSLLARRISDATGPTGRPILPSRAARAIVSVPVDAGTDDVRLLVAALRQLVPDEQVTVLPAVVAAVGSLAEPARTSLVVDVGAQLVEVALVQDGIVVASQVLDWGMDDLVESVRAALASRDDLLVDRREAERGLITGVASGRGALSHEARVVRVESALALRCAAPALDWLDEAIDAVGAGADPRLTPLIGVGGGMRSTPLREHLRTHAGGRRVVVAPHPRHATLCGLAAATGDPADRIGLPALLAATR